MNRRQRKKAYKKKYGHNPPKTEVRYHGKEWGRIVSRAMDEIVEAISGLVPAIKKAIDSLANMAAEAKKILRPCRKKTLTGYWKIQTWTKEPKKWQGG